MCVAPKIPAATMAPPLENKSSENVRLNRKKGIAAQRAAAGAANTNATGGLGVTSAAPVVRAQALGA